MVSSYETVMHHNHVLPQFLDMSRSCGWSMIKAKINPNFKQHDWKCFCFAMDRDQPHREFLLCRPLQLHRAFKPVSVHCFGLLVRRQLFSMKRSDKPTVHYLPCSKQQKDKVSDQLVKLMQSSRQVFLIVVGGDQNRAKKIMNIAHKVIRIPI